MPRTGFSCRRASRGFYGLGGVRICVCFLMIDDILMIVNMYFCKWSLPNFKRSAFGPPSDPILCFCWWLYPVVKHVLTSWAAAAGRCLITNQHPTSKAAGNWIASAVMRMTAMKYGDFLSHGDIPKSSKSLDQFSTETTMVTTGDPPWLKKPAWSYRGEICPQQVLKICRRHLFQGLPLSKAPVTIRMVERGRTAGLHCWNRYIISSEFRLIVFVFNLDANIFLHENRPSPLSDKHNTDKIRIL